MQGIRFIKYTALYLIYLLFSLKYGCIQFLIPCLIKSLIHYVLIALAMYFTDVSYVAAQSPRIDSLKKIVSLEKHDTVELDALLQLSNEFLRKDLTQTKRYSFKIISLAKAKEEAKWLAGAYNYQVTINQQMGKTDSAKHFLALSEVIAKQNTDNLLIQYNFNQTAGLFYKNMGEYNRALPYMLNNL